MAHQAPVLTLGQLLRQAREVQGLSLRQVAARLHHPNGRSITPKYLHLLERDRRRPSLALAHECATVLALDTLLVLTLAHRADGLLQRYLHRCPQAEMALIEMLLQAEHHGFVGWERVTRHIVTPESASMSQYVIQARRMRRRKSDEA